MAAVILSLFQVNTVEELGFDYVLVISFHIIVIFVVSKLIVCNYLSSRFLLVTNKNESRILMY